MSSRGTDRRQVRVDADLWERFNQAVHAVNENGDRSTTLRAFMRWYCREPGAKLPDRPKEQT